MMDITDYKPCLFHEFDDQTDLYIYQKQHLHLTVRNNEQLDDHESAQSYYPDTTEQEVLNSYYPVSKDVCPNLPVGGVVVLGVVAPPNLPRPRTDESSASIRSRPSSDDEMSETAANRTDVCVAINTQEPVDPLESWNETTMETPILFPVNDAAYHTTTPAEKLSMMQLYRCVMDANCPRYFLDKFLHILRDEISSEQLSLDSAPSRSAFVNYFTKKYPTAPPILRDIPLETDVTNVSITSPEARLQTPSWQCCSGSYF
jgi:hypothetical protein